MDRYFCKCCNYKANNIHYMNKHISTKKHENGLKTFSGADDAVVKMKFFVCKHCKKEFKCNVTKWKHEKT